MRPKGLTSARIKEALGPVWWLLPLCAQLGAKRRADDVAKGGTTVDDRAVPRAVRSGSHRDRFRGVVRGLCMLVRPRVGPVFCLQVIPGWTPSLGRVGVPLEAAKRLPSERVSRWIALSHGAATRRCAGRGPC